MVMGMTYYDGFVQGTKKKAGDTRWQPPSRRLRATCYYHVSQKIHLTAVRQIRQGERIPSTKIFGDHRDNVAGAEKSARSHTYYT